jgi:hypothetical protein
MFNLRHKRTTRDRQSGLVFQWRLPVGNTVRFLLALGIVGLVTAGLAASVRVRVGSVSRQPERRGTMILVPQGKEWQALEMLALEAGPMPRRSDPAGDEAVKGLIDQSMAKARPPGYRYEPELRPVTVEIPIAAAKDEKSSPGVLPPLPVSEPPSQNPPLPDPARPVILSSEGVHALAPAAVPPASLARGNRYLLGYDANGRVTRVTTLFSAEPAADDESVEQWLRQVTIEGGDKGGGWTAVEIASGS